MGGAIGRVRDEHLFLADKMDSFGLAFVEGKPVGIGEGLKDLPAGQVPHFGDAPSVVGREYGLVVGGEPVHLRRSG